MRPGVRNTCKSQVYQGLAHTYLRLCTDFFWSATPLPWAMKNFKLKIEPLGFRVTLTDGLPWRRDMPIADEKGAARKIK